MAWSFHAIDATQSLTHWLISTQVKRLQKQAPVAAKKGGEATRRKWEKATRKEKKDYAASQSKLQDGYAFTPDQHNQLVKLIKVNSRRESSRCILVELVAPPSTRRASETRATHPSFPCAGTWSI